MGNTNCKEEFLEHVKDTNQEVLCAKIIGGKSYGKTISFELPVNFSELQMEAFLVSLDFEYYAGYGGQEIDGTIWYKDGTWSSRGEYDGSEGWEYNSCPEIPEELRK
jgi:hypothetical protein